MLSTGALAQVQLPIQSWKELDPEVRGKLINVWTPSGMG
jgi:hypothetical protein